MRKLGLVLLCLLVSLGLAETALAQGVNPQFGVIEAYEAADAADELGVGWTRVRFPWAEVQPNGPDEWLGVVDDEVISAEIAANREVVGLLIGMPQWARDTADLPNGLYLDHTDPNNLWANYVRDAVTRYQGEIDHWIIWNEPDIWDENTPGFTWHGTEADFAQLMRVAYRTAKAVDPDVVIHLSAMTFFWDNNFGRTQYLDRLLTEIAKDPDAAANNYYFDVATAHLYFQPNQMFDILAIWNGILEKHGQQDKAWWLAETNAPVVDDPSWPVDSVTFNVTQQDQANFMGQGIATALAAGVERVAIFKLIDTQSDRAANPEPFGLLRDDGSPRPGFAAYRAVTQLLRDVTGAERERWDGVGQVRVERGDGSLVHVLFARDGGAYSAEVAAQPNMTATLYNNLGEVQVLDSAEAGVYTIPLPPSPCSEPVGDTCLIGGDTQFLVQVPSSTQPATSPPQQLAAITDYATAAAVEFPNRMTFALEYASERPIVEATLNFNVDKFTCAEVATNVPVEIETPGEASWTWQMVRSGNPPPGTDISWEWTLTDDTGATFTTETETITLADERFEWRSIESERITLHWYDGDDVGPTLMTAAVDSLARLEADMGIVLNEDVDIWVYGSAADMRDAMLYVQGWAGGVAFSEYNTVLLGVAPNRVDGWGVRVTAHELAHLVLGQFGRSCVGGNRPTWLEEGFAMYAEGDPENGTLADVAGSIEDDDLAPVRALVSGFPAHGSNAREAYSQSWSIIDFMLDAYGGEKLQALVLSLAEGTDTDAALEAIYGLNMDGLESAWRQEIGADARQILPTVTPISAELIPTYEPIAGAVDVPTPAAFGNDAAEEPDPLPTAEAVNAAQDDREPEAIPAPTATSALAQAEPADNTTTEDADEGSGLPSCLGAMVLLPFAAVVVGRGRRKKRPNTPKADRNL